LIFQPLGRVGLVAAALALLLAISFSVIGLAPRAEAAPAPVTVTIDNFTFGPATITVPVGTTVTWVNQDDIPHTVVSDDKKTFRSKVLDTDDRFSFTFTTPGSYGYFCSIHPHMTGKVVVKAP
jgi:plastocyanin